LESRPVLEAGKYWWVGWPGGVAPPGHPTRIGSVGKFSGNDILLVGRASPDGRLGFRDDESYLRLVLNDE